MKRPSVNGTDIGYSMYPSQQFVPDGLSYLLTMAGSLPAFPLETIMESLWRRLTGGPSVH